MGLFRLKQHNFVIFRNNSRKLGGTVYILLPNSCVKFMQKSPRIAEISTEVTAISFYIHPVYAYHLEICIVGAYVIVTL